MSGYLVMYVLLPSHSLTQYYKFCASQETLKSQQENNEKEREKLLNLLQELRKELNQKQIAVDSERREIR